MKTSESHRSAQWSGPIPSLAADRSPLVRGPIPTWEQTAWEWTGPLSGADWSAPESSPHPDALIGLDRSHDF